MAREFSDSDRTALIAAGFMHDANTDNYIREASANMFVIISDGYEFDDSTYHVGLHNEGACPEEREVDSIAEALEAANSLLISVVFSQKLLADIGPDNLAAVNALNDTEEYSGNICASHDYCDANMPMFEAVKNVTGLDPEVSDETYAALWSDAWDIAKRNRFFV